MVVGDNGIIAKAGTAKDKTNESQAAEENRLADYENKIDALGRAGGNISVELLYGTTKEQGIPTGSITLSKEVDQFDYIQVIAVNPDEWRGHHEALYYKDIIVCDNETDYEIDAYDSRYISFKFGTDKKSITRIYNSPIGIYRVYGIKFN